MKKYNVVIVGALGAVGKEFRKILLQRQFPIEKIKFVDLADVGSAVDFGDKQVYVEAPSDDVFNGYDIALFSAGGSVSLEMAKKAVRAGCIVIDNSSAWRMDPSVPLIVPEVNPQDIEKHEGIIANPNCSTIQLMLPLKLIHEVAKIKRLVISTYQAVSGTGVNAIQECLKQSLEVSQGKNISDVQVYPHQIAFNALPHIDDFIENGYTKEEMKLVNETRKILGDSSIKITATAVRVPVIYGHSESVNIETEKNISPSAVRELLKGKPGIVVLDEPDKNIYPMPIDAAGKDDIFVGRIRKDESIDNGINMWVVSDNIRKGAALNTIQIGELLIKKGLI